MNIPSHVPVFDERILKLTGLVEIAAASLRSQGKEEDAIALFRLRIRMRKGLPFEQSQAIFDEHTKTVVKNSEEKHLA